MQKGVLRPDLSELRALSPYCFINLDERLSFPFFPIDFPTTCNTVVFFLGVNAATNQFK